MIYLGQKGTFIALIHGAVHTRSASFFLSLSTTVVKNVQADAGFLCDKAATLGKKMKETPCI
jgi:hypothetical protein